MKTMQTKSQQFSSILTLRGLDRKYSQWSNALNNFTESDVKGALSSQPGVYRPEKLMVLVSPAARGHLEQMAQLAHQLTVQRFGKTIKLYVPLYLSNYCSSSCRYCGFNVDNKIERKRLTIEEALEQADIIANEGFRDILLVSSEDRNYITVEYLCELSKQLRKKFSCVSIEVYQMTAAEYSELFAAGIEGVTLYQETYDRDVYKYYHPAGLKTDYGQRLNVADDMAAAGMREIGLGALLGLADWRVETLALGEHAHYLMKRYWQSHISISFPRIRPASHVDGQQFEHLLSDKDMVQMMLALRLCFADVGLVLSTREPASLRDNMVSLGITRMSAGSKTSPGGYCKTEHALEQFDVNDSRSASQIAEMLRERGLDAVWKDWDCGFIDNK